MEQIVSCNCGPLVDFDPLKEKDAFSRFDEGDDSEFYSTDRFVSHLDQAALETVTNIVEQLVVEEEPVILDLMASWDSHLPASLKPAHVAGLGLNRNELEVNPALDEIVIHDLNRDPTLPWPDGLFDLVINTVSVDYLTRPQEVFQEAVRVLKPGGLLLVVFSNRMFRSKAVKVWRESSEEERVIMVEDLFRKAGGLRETTLFVSKGRPRPKDDKYADLGLPSDPIYAVYAEKVGGPAGRGRPEVVLGYGEKMEKAELERRKSEIKENHCCPYCGEKMKKWEVPDNPFGQTWDNDYMYICFNDRCSYYVRGWGVMEHETGKTCSYRLMYNPDKDCCLPIPVPSPHSLKEGVVEE